MCAPVAIGVVLSGVATAMTAVESANSAAAAKSSARYQAASAQAQAQTAQYEAAYARQQAQQDAAELRRELLRSQGTQRSLLAVGGAVLDQGSALDVLLDSASQSAREQEQRLAEGEREAWRYETQAQSLLGNAGYHAAQAAAKPGAEWTWAKQGSSVLAGTGG